MSGRNEKLPLLPLRDSVLMPHVAMPIAVGRPGSRAAALAAAGSDDKRLVFVLQRSPKDDPTELSSLYAVGTLGLVRRVQEQSGNALALVAQGDRRVSVDALERRGDMLVVGVRPRPLQLEKGPRVTALRRELEGLLQRALGLAQGEETVDLSAVLGTDDPERFLYTVGAMLSLEAKEAQALLEMDDGEAALHQLHAYLSREVQVLQIRHEIASQTAGELQREQREHILRRQLRTIQDQLGEASPEKLEVEGLRQRLKSAGLPEPVMKEAERELARLERLPAAAAEYPMLHTYFELLLDLPWSRSSDARIDIPTARRILDEDHYGLRDVKERILEHLAALKLNPSAKSPILCLQGPPGVGKTSLGQSIARATGRAFERLSLGGMHDEAELRGHRRTYVGAMPGRILQALRRAGVNNPVLMLDEIDKLGHDFRGDPAAALLEVLDPEQNRAFRDNYLDQPFDLTKVLFVTTCNTLDSVPRPLIDRMDVVRLAGYTREEKIEIARRYLWPRQRQQVGLPEGACVLGASTLDYLISHYTREAGVRQLERTLGRILRRVALTFTQGDTKPVIVEPQNLAELIGPEPFFVEQARPTLTPGVAAGLAWTEVGGEVLYVEAAYLPGRTGLVLTGHLGEVMQESARAAETCVWARAQVLGLPLSRLKDGGAHVHVPAGAVPKDGPSAGVAVATALASLYLNRATRRDTAMTGEVTITGLILPVGGIKEKLLAARQAGIRRVILPKANEKDLRELDEGARRGLELILVSDIEEVWREALGEAQPAAEAGELDAEGQPELADSAPEVAWLWRELERRDALLRAPAPEPVPARARRPRREAGGMLMAPPEGPTQSPPTGGTPESAGADPLRAYLRRVRAAPRMTREQEVEAGRRIEAGERQVLETVFASPLLRTELPGIDERLSQRGGPLAAEEIDHVVERLASLMRALGSAAGDLRKLEARLGLPRATLAGMGAGEGRVREVARRHELSAEAARTLRAGLKDYASRRAAVESQAGMSAEALLALHKEVQAGERMAAAAKADLVEAHLRDVVYVARRYAERGVPLSDLIQEGNIGLMTAANKFDYKLGHRFATYAGWWIRQAIGRALAEQGRTIRLPVHRTEALTRLAGVRRRLLQRFGREPTTDELAVDLGLERADVEQLEAWAKSVVSLETPIGREEEGRLSDVVPNPDAELPSAAVMAAELAMRTQEQLGALSPREQEVLALRFGINEDHELTLEEIGKRFGVTRERIRQIEARALSKLRHPARARALKGFIERD